MQKQIYKDFMRGRKMILKIIIGVVAGGVIGAVSGYLFSCTGGTCPLAGSPWRGAITGAVIGFIFTLQ
jgi:gas vesicle protein